MRPWNRCHKCSPRKKSLFDFIYGISSCLNCLKHLRGVLFPTWNKNKSQIFNAVPNFSTHQYILGNVFLGLFDVRGEGQSSCHSHCDKTHTVGTRSEQDWWKAALKGSVIEMSTLTSGSHKVKFLLGLACCVRLQEVMEEWTGVSVSQLYT